MATARRTATNENISTYGGGTRDYTALATWEAFTDVDLVTAAQSEVLECYDDAASFDDQAIIAGATTDTSYFRIIRPATGQGHDGTPNNGFTIANTSTVDDVFDVRESNFQLQDLILSNNISSASSFDCVRIQIIGVQDVRVIGCIAYDSTNSGIGGMSGFSCPSGSAGGFGFIDCMAHNMETSGFVISGTLTGCFFYNCVAYGNGSHGFDTANANTIYKNCLSNANGGNAFNGTGNASSSNNVDDDSTAPGSSNQTGTVTFVNIGGDDFHLSPSDTVAQNNGVDLSADGTFAFDDDIDGNTFGTWDIGFDEPTVAGLEDEEEIGLLLLNWVGA